MNDTTKWIMIILLLLLIAAAVFMLLRSPGKDNGNADAVTGRDDADRDGVRDAQENRIRPAAGTADRGVYDQEADTRDGRAAAATGAVETGDREPVEAAPSEDTTAAPVETSTYDDTTTTPVEVPPAHGEEGTGSRSAEPETAAGWDEDTEDTEGGATAATVPAEERRDDAGYRQETLDGDDGSTRDQVDDDWSTDTSTDTQSWTDTHAGPDTAAGWDASPADTGVGAPQTADDILDDRRDDPATGTTTEQSGFAPVFTEAAYGPGSAEPLEDGSGPAGWEVKGNIGSMLFHTPESPSYDSVRAEVWFQSEEAARSAGFAHWDRRRR